jgi:sigma-B regulation protein RsbU (phosphoserine phosphatase)
MLYVMSFTLAVTFLAAFRAMKSETRGRYVGMMNLVSEKINSEIKWMEIGAKNVFDEIECHLDSPEDIIKALEEEIRLNDYVEGYFVAFEPYYFPQQGKWFEPYTHKVRKEEREKGKEEAHTYQTDQVASASHDYFKADWYQRAKKESKPFWSDPYTLDNEKHLPGLFCTYIIPIYDKQGRFIGVFGADLLLKNLIRDLKRIDVESRNEGMKNISKRYSNLDFYSFIINEKGTYIAHPEEERAMKQNIRSYVENGKLYGDCERVIRDMTQMKKGIGPMKVDGLWADVYYSPLQSTNWSMAIVVQKRVFLQPIFYLLLILLLATVLGEILISIICRRNIRKETRPLVSLTQSANEVAKGNFKAPLPELEYKDEVSNLRDSFATMQSSLTKYIQDLEETTTKKAAMENELNVAKKIQMSMIPNKFAIPQAKRYRPLRLADTCQDGRRRPLRLFHSQRPPLLLHRRCQRQGRAFSADDDGDTLSVPKLFLAVRRPEADRRSHERLLCSRQQVDDVLHLLPRGARPEDGSVALLQCRPRGTIHGHLGG